jgi:hypothetical protein
MLRRRLLPVPLLVLALAAAPVAVSELGDGPRSAAAAEDAPSNAPVAVGGPFGRTSISAGWTVRNDPRDSGRGLGWKDGDFTGSTVDLPYVPNAKNITGAAGVLGHRGSIAWYRKTITVPKDGDYAIGFGSVNHEATVWIDGRQVASHLGEFLPFEARAGLKAGREHTIVVRADWRDPETMKKQGYHRGWFNYGGITRDVTLRPLGASDTAAPSVVTELQPGGSAKVTVSADFTNRAGTRAIAPVGVLRRGDRTFTLRFPSQRFTGGQTRRLAASVVIDEPDLWSSTAPNLYDMVVGVASESAYQTRTGLRVVSVRNGAIYVNGTRVQLRGASIHEDAPGVGDGLRPEQMDGLIDDLKAIGANATRAQHPLDPALLERLDEAGIMVWQGIGPFDSPGSWTHRTAAQQRRARERVAVTLAEQQTHPSTIVWNLANEIAKNGNRHGQVPYVRAMSRMLKEKDPNRLVALDLWGTPKELCMSSARGVVELKVRRGTAKRCDLGGGRRGRMVWETRLPEKVGPVYQYIDAIGITNYEGWYSEPGQPMSYIARRIKAYLKLAERVYRGKALVLTEFGAEANGENPSSKPGGYGYQSNLIRTTIDAYASDPNVQGFLVWNLRDFGVSPAFLGGSIRNVYKGHPIRLVRGLNQKGLFTYENRPKPAVAVTKAALARAAQTGAGRR